MRAEDAAVEGERRLESEAGAGEVGAPAGTGGVGCEVAEGGAHFSCGGGRWWRLVEVGGGFGSWGAILEDVRELPRPGLRERVM